MLFIGFPGTTDFTDYADGINNLKTSNKYKTTGFPPLRE
jgi:hypothetical protein